MEGLHLLLTQQCSRECPHCFVWGSPEQKAVMKGRQVERYLIEAKEAGLSSVAVEGGEPFLHYQLLLYTCRLAARLDLEVTVLSNCFWAVSEEDALRYLQPLAETGVAAFMFSTDEYHGDREDARRVKVAAKAAEELGLHHFMARTELENVMFKGRAAQELAGEAKGSEAGTHDRCEKEDLKTPSRCHLDVQGNLHVCQGLIIDRVDGNTLGDIIQDYDWETHPIIAPLAKGGPRALVEHYSLNLEGLFADACHLCYLARRRLRKRFPRFLGPDSMYGVYSSTR